MQIEEIRMRCVEAAVACRDNRLSISEQAKQILFWVLNGKTTEESPPQRQTPSEDR